MISNNMIRELDPLRKKCCYQRYYNNNIYFLDQFTVIIVLIYQAKILLIMKRFGVPRVDAEKMFDKKSLIISQACYNR